MAEEDYELIGANVVLLAQSHNPSIVTKDWITNNEIIEEDVSNFVNTPAFSLIETPSFNLALDTNRLQLSLKRPRKSQVQRLTKSIKSYVERLPETPYTAVGLNFVYRIPEGRKIRERFLPENEAITELTGSETHRGMRLVFKYTVFKVQMDLRPTGEVQHEVHFNFHRDVDGANQIASTVRRHNSAIRKSEGILRGIIDGGG